MLFAMYSYIVLLSGDVFALRSIADNGACLISHIDYKGDLATPKTVTFEDMTRSYTPCKVQPPKFAEYPQNGLHCSEEWTFHEYRARVTMALCILTRMFAPASVRIRALPKKAVFATRRFKIGECIIVPTTMKVKCWKTESATATAKVFACGGDAPKGLQLELAPMSADLPCPAWIMQSVAEKKEANMKVKMVKVELTLTVLPSGSDDRQHIMIPVLENSKTLKEDDELLYHIERDAPEGSSGSSKKRTFDLI